jgi:DNA-binding transcriptional LysR family regulator
LLGTAASAVRPPPLRRLPYVVAVADALSFRRAAKHCDVSQPSLSVQLAQLEDALGVRLFERDRKGARDTAGADFVARARGLLIEAHDLVDAGKRRSAPLAPCASESSRPSSCTCSRWWRPNFVSGFLAQEVIATDPFVLDLRRDHPLARKRGPVEADELRVVEKAPPR